MASEVMTKADVMRVVKETLQEFLIDREKRYENVSLLERVVRVEEGILRIEQRFQDLIVHMDKRFEAVDKRFEDVNKRFSMMFVFMNIGFSILIVITTIFKFVA